MKYSRVNLNKEKGLRSTSSSLSNISEEGEKDRMWCDGGLCAAMRCVWRACWPVNGDDDAAVGWGGRRRRQTRSREESRKVVYVCLCVKHGRLGRHWVGDRQQDHHRLHIIPLI